MKTWKHLHKTIGGGASASNAKAIEVAVAAHQNKALELTDEHREQIEALAIDLEAKNQDEHAAELREALASLEAPKNKKAKA